MKDGYNKGKRTFVISHCAYCEHKEEFLKNRDTLICKELDGEFSLSTADEKCDYFKVKETLREEYKEYLMTTVSNLQEVVDLFKDDDIVVEKIVNVESTEIINYGNSVVWLNKLTSIGEDITFIDHVDKHGYVNFYTPEALFKGLYKSKPFHVIESSVWDTDEKLVKEIINKLKEYEKTNK